MTNLFKTTWLLLMLGATTLLSAQESNLRNYNHIYKDYIKSVQFHVKGQLLSDPIVPLDGSKQLVLSFDDLDGDVKDYFYSIVHCDRNWQPSNLQEMEYIDGFNEERINTFQFSVKTLWPYTHYQLTLPNQDMRWRVSGNYLLLVYDESNNRELIITRRFTVVDQQVKIAPDFVPANDVSKINTHQEIDFTVLTKDINIRNPLQEITATILQNGRWDNAITGVEPKFIRPDQLIFDFQDRVVFPGGKEFRFLDLRNLRSVSFEVASVQQEDGTYVVEMKADQPRDKIPYTNFQDINGDFLIITGQQNLHDDVISDYQRDQIFAEYADVSFALETEREPGYDVYLYGAFSDWRPQERYRLEYDESLGAYTGWSIFKQGYYDFMYAAVPKENNDRRFAQERKADFSIFEGNSDETINEYTIIIYYRPYGSRYDMAIGTRTFCYGSMLPCDGR